MMAIKVYFIRFAVLLAKSHSMRFYFCDLRFLWCFWFAVGLYLLIKLDELKF